LNKINILKENIVESNKEMARRLLQKIRNTEINEVEKICTVSELIKDLLEYDRNTIIKIKYQININNIKEIQ
jgi:hypothetical protein